MRENTYNNKGLLVPTAVESETGFVSLRRRRVLLHDADILSAAAASGRAFKNVCELTHGNNYWLLLKDLHLRLQS